MMCREDESRKVTLLCRITYQSSNNIPNNELTCSDLWGVLEPCLEDVGLNPSHHRLSTCCPKDNLSTRTLDELTK